ncbi:MAG: hypothetical protein HQM12_19110, partial [SAR324 cluster bacterium]|nr:hypothetical protein [SAR324 cluster bacterium]
VSIYEIRGLVKNTIFQIQSAHALKKEMAARKQAHQLLKSTLDVRLKASGKPSAVSDLL